MLSTFVFGAAIGIGLFIGWTLVELIAGKS